MLNRDNGMIQTKLYIKNKRRAVTFLLEGLELWFLLSALLHIYIYSNSTLFINFVVNILNGHEDKILTDGRTDEAGL